MVAALRERWHAAVRSHRLPGLRTGKLTLAAVLAYVLASGLDTSADHVLAPLTALLVVQLTLYQTLAAALGRTISVLLGVLVAVGVAELAGLTWWSLGLVVLASLVAGQLLRLREHVMEVPISAMIVLALGGQAGSAAGRVVETVLGGAVGLVVNLVVAPPLHVRPAEDAVERLAVALAGFLDELAGDMAAGWSRGRADGWLERARRLHRDVDRADVDLQRFEESARLNPRGARARDARPRLRSALTALEHCYVSMRNLCRALLDRTYSLPEDQEAQAYPEAVRCALADVLDAAGRALRCAGRVSAGGWSPQEARNAMSAVLAESRERRDALAGLLLVDPSVDEGAWEQHGALLAAVDRLRVEVEAAVRAPDVAWRPEPLAARQREAVRRVVNAPRARPFRRRR